MSDAIEADRKQRMLRLMVAMENRKARGEDTELLRLQILSLAEETNVLPRSAHRPLTGG